MSAWEFRKEAHGIKGDLKRKEDEFFVTHDVPQWLSKKAAHVPDPKAAASKSRRGRDSPELNEARREIIVDSGASRRMIGLSELNETEKNTIRKLKQPFLIQTAHGVVACDKEAKIYIHDLDLWVWAGLLEDSPAVLSLGLLCKEMGFSFSWKEGEDYGFLKKRGKTIKCKTVCNVPTITIATESESQEASESEGTDSESSSSSYEPSLVSRSSCSSGRSSSSSSSRSSWVSTGSELEAVPPGKEGDVFDRALAPF